MWAPNLLALVIGVYDPVIDQRLDPWAGLALDVGVQRLQDEFGFRIGASSPRFLEQHLAIHLAGGLGFYPDLRALPEDAETQDFGAWSTYGHLRLQLEGAVRLAPAAGRIYARMGPSLLVLSDRLSTKKVAPGWIGAVGLELFAGDRWQSWPWAIFFEAGAGGHLAHADIANRAGAPQTVDLSVDRPIGTGLFLAAGIRWYAWR